jgi:uncharacterized protein (DUF1800 family)
VSRRQVIGGALAAGSLAVAYAALGDKFSLFGSESENEIAAADTAAIKKESVRISHLLRRAGFGASRDEYEHYQSLGLDGTINELVNFAQVDDADAANLAGRFIEPEQQPDRAAAVLWWLTRMANTKRPLQEKMTLFWHGLLTSQMSVVRAPAAMIAQNEFFRSHAFAPFPEVLRGISMDPAMMVYLDTAGSQSRAPNENYARELMELFALGEGNYSEEDVREAARAFTGWQVPRVRSDLNTFILETPVFRRQQFDDGEKTFLGKTGNFLPDDIIDIVVEQPAAGQYVVRRLFEFFVFPDATDTDVKPFVEVYEKQDKRIGAVVEAMLRSDVFYSPKAYRALVKSPIEYAVGAIKAIGGQQLAGQYAGAGLDRGPRGGGGVLGAMGQVPFEPPNVAGWPGGATWLNSTTMFARLNFIDQLTGGAERPRRRRDQPAPAPISGDFGTIDQALAYYLPLAVDDNLPEAARQVLQDFAGGSQASLSEAHLRGLVYLVLASPQFHLS